MARTALAERIEQAIEREAGLTVLVEEDNGTIILTGLVDSPRERQAAEDVALTVAPDVRIDNGLEVNEEVPLSVDDYLADVPTAENLPDDVSELDDPSQELEPDFTNEIEGAPAADQDDEMPETFDAPTDPVIRVDESGEAHVLGGFSPSNDDVSVARSALDGRPGDEAIADAVRRELREDAATTHLNLTVIVRDGVVTLRGVVEGIEDAENAEEVAGRIPNVVDVIDETTVPGL